MKTVYFLLFATYILGGGLAAAATAIINFGGSNNTPAYSNGVIDNILQANSIAIHTTAEENQGWKFASWVGRTPTASLYSNIPNTIWNNNTHFADFMSTLNLPVGTTVQDFASVWKNGINLKSGSGELTFSGLVAGRTYTISLGIGRAEVNGCVMNISTNMGTLTSGNWFMSDNTSGDSALTSYTANAVNRQAVASYQIIADSNGKIQLGLNNSTQFIALQFATISDSIPEPSSTTLALFGLSVIGLRRSRKQ